MERLEQLLDELKRRSSTDNRILLASGTSYVHPDGFFIEVPSGGGAVRYRTAGGQIITETMSAGYHPTKFVEIYTATAVALVIVF